MQDKLKRIKCIAFDVDGVMTDGTLFVTDAREYVRKYNVKDSFAIRMAVMQGFIVTVITGGNTPGIQERFLTCGVRKEDIYMGCRGKIKTLDVVCEKYGISREEVIYVGDDIPDTPVIRAAGIGVCPADAVQEAKDAADWVSDIPGGHGCIRNVIETVLKAQGKWNFNVEDYERLF